MWHYEPTPTIPMEGGVIVMLCGDFYRELDINKCELHTNQVASLVHADITK